MLYLQSRYAWSWFVGNLPWFYSNSGGAHCRPQPAGLADVDSPIHAVHQFLTKNDQLKDPVILEKLVGAVIKEHAKILYKFGSQMWG